MTLTSWIGSYCIVHTIMHHLSTPTYMPNFIKIDETFCGRMVEYKISHYSGSA